MERRKDVGNHSGAAMTGAMMYNGAHHEHAETFLEYLSPVRN
jgi:hypothetical protein